MIIQGGFLEEGHTAESEVCIVGSGAAGLTLARELAGRGVDVVLVESGGLVRKPRTRALLEVESTGRSDYPVGITRERYFGGTTNHWGGVCRPYDAFDLEAHDWMPRSGWPIDRATLDPWYESAAEMLGLPEVDPVFDAAEWGIEASPRLIDAERFGVASTRWHRVGSERLRMGTWLHEEVKASPRIRCIMNATVAEIHVDETATRVDHLEARTFAKRTIRLRARDYVLCTGGIENARLLLLSDSRVSGGLGNANDLVGRHFMDHPGRVLGRVVVTDTRMAPSQEELLVLGKATPPSEIPLIGWHTTPELRRAHALQGFMCFGLWMGEVEDYGDDVPHTRAILDLAAGPHGVPVTDDDPRRFFHLGVNWEQAPNPSSRVTLSTERDLLGIRKARVHWEVSEADLRSARKSAELISIAVARTGRARVHLEDITGGDRINNGGGHHMGTTPMADDPKRGVTDRDGRVHGLGNLFVGGSSLFPTGGWQHPTFTIVALALRQAEHLAHRAAARA